MRAIVRAMASAETWAKRVAAWRESGQSADAFAAGRGFAGNTLRWWASALRRRDARLVRVVVAETPAAPEREEAIEIELHGARVRVRAGVDRATLATVIAVLDERGRP